MRMSFAMPLALCGLFLLTTSAISKDVEALNVAKDALKNAPGFDKKSWPDFADPNFTAKIEAFYSNPSARTGSVQPR
jgi:hypothetical protein